MLDLLVDDVSEILTIEKLSAENLNGSFSVLNDFEEYKTFLYNDALNYIDAEKALELFYKSNTYMLMSKGISDFHCLSDAYLAEEILLEQK